MEIELSMVVCLMSLNSNLSWIMIEYPQTCSCHPVLYCVDTPQSQQFHLNQTLHSIHLSLPIFQTAYNTPYKIWEKQPLDTSFIKAPAHDMKEGVSLIRHFGWVHLNWSKIWFNCIHNTQLFALLRNFCLGFYFFPAIYTIENAISCVECIIHSISIDFDRCIQCCTRFLEISFNRITIPLSWIPSIYDPFKITSSIWLMRSKFHVFFWLIF